MSLYESGKVVKELVFDAIGSKHSDHGSNLLLGMTFGVNKTITSVRLHIVRGQLIAVFSISTGILGAV